ncbi:hypothetical protein EYC84_002716 [Monilinia fructicola]|uniref:Uncharacterized protein n=1 Tax=Monilinia fructicola TaxID=38448 RepID=A0A5M9JP59_MONFR|nr:hypothetical protein EYC84_002716 [Monilinia fructicola]
MEDIDREARLSAAYTTRLDQTLQDLQERVKEQEALLEKLRATTSIPITDGPSPDPKTHLRQLLALKHAYDTLSTTPPHLPPPKSALPRPPRLPHHFNLHPRNATKPDQHIT